MTSKKQKIQKAIWDMTKPFINVPDSKDHMAEYMATRRKIEKMTENPEFIKGFKKQYDSFYLFLMEYDLNLSDIRTLMHTDLSEFLQPRPQRRRQ